MTVRRAVRLELAVAVTVVLALVVSVGWGYWTAGSVPGGGGASAAASVGPGATPTTTAVRGAVTVSWAASTLTTGDPVTGYLVNRYDAVTLVQQTTESTCAGVVAATGCVESGVPTGSWAYTVTPVFATSWLGAESGRSIAQDVDATPPVNALSASSVTGGAALSGTTLYYRGVAAGSVRLTNTVTDADSGPASSETHALVGGAGGWAHLPSLVDTPTGGPFESTAFTWSAGTSSGPQDLVTGRDVQGNSADTIVSFVDDSTAPTGSTVDYPDGLQAGVSVSVTTTTGTDGGSGLGTRQLQRDTAAVSGPGCGTFTGYADLGPDAPGSPYVDDTVEDGHCYRYRYLVRDRVGNLETATSTHVATFDSSGGGPPMGSAWSYSVLGGTGVVSSGSTTVSGDLGVSPSDVVTGFPPGIVAGTTHAGDAAAAIAQSDLVLAYDDANARVPDTQFAGDLIGRTFHPGVHHSAAAVALTGTVTLDADGDPAAVFIFQIDAALSPAAGSQVVLVDGAQPSHVFWQVEGAVSTGALSTFSGTILAAGAVTLGDGSVLIGSARSFGTVTLSSNTIRFTAAVPPAISLDGGPTAVTKDPSPTISGSTSSAVGTTVRVTIDGQVLTTTVLAGGDWNVTAAAVLGGVYPVTASVRDAAGNAGTASQLLTVEVNPAPVLLGTAGTYSVLAGTSVVSTGTTSVNHDVGVSPGAAVSGFPPGTVGGAIHAGDAAAAQAMADAVLAYDDADSRRPSSEFAGDLIGRTFHAGVHHTAAAVALTGAVTLDAEGNPDAVFIFQIDAALSPAAGGQVVLANGAQASNVFWQVEGAVSTGALSSFSGTILTAGAITLGAGAGLSGAALSFGTVTLSSNTVTSP